MQPLLRSPVLLVRAVGPNLSSSTRLFWGCQPVSATGVSATQVYLHNSKTIDRFKHVKARRWTEDHASSR